MPNFEPGRSRVVIVLNRIDRSAVYTMLYAKTLSNDIIAFVPETDANAGDNIKAQWEELQTGIPIVVQPAVKQGTAASLIAYIRSKEYAYREEDVVTVVLPLLSAAAWWQRFLCNGGVKALARKLSKQGFIHVCVLPCPLSENV